MEFKLRKLNASEAKKLSHILKDYSCEALLKTKKYCIDGKSILGILSIMEAEPNDITLVINELSEEFFPELVSKLSPFFTC